MSWLQLSAGRGPAECQRFVAFLADEIQEDARRNGIQAQILEQVAGEQDQTLRSALLSLDGEGIENFASSWEGTHKWICPSPYRPNHGRKNWFAGVRTFNAPELPSWSENELRIDTMRSSGPGGQHVNKTSSAVRLTHTPTGLSVTATEERSQHRNRKLALARLARVFEGAAEKTMDSKQTELWLQHWQLERGNEVRTYTGPKFKLNVRNNGEY